MSPVPWSERRNTSARGPRISAKCEMGGFRVGDQPHSRKCAMKTSAGGICAAANSNDGQGQRAADVTSDRSVSVGMKRRIDHQVAQLPIASELAQTSPAFVAEIVGNTAVVAAVFRKRAVMKRIALQFAIDCRTTTAKLSGDLVDRDFAFSEPEEAPAISQSELQIAKGHRIIGRAAERPPPFSGHGRARCRADTKLERDDWT